jgi:hypothetical protein
MMGFLDHPQSLKSMGFISVTNVVGHFQIHIPVPNIEEPTRRFAGKLKGIS